MTGVERDGDNNLLALRRAVDTARAEMVLHVARSLNAIRVGFAFEFGEHLNHRFTNHVGEHVQPPAMRHSNDGFVGVLIRGAIQNFIQNRDSRFSAFETEPLLADKPALQKVLELLRLNQAVQRANFRTDSSSGHRFMVASIRSCSHCFCTGS